MKSDYIALTHVVALSLGTIAVSAALVAVLCCTRRPPKVGNTPLVLLLVSLLAIAAAAGGDEPPPRKVSRLLIKDLDTQDSPMPPIFVETETEPEDDGEDADDDDEVYDSNATTLCILGHSPPAPRANRTYLTLEPDLPGPFEAIEEELSLGGKTAATPSTNTNTNTKYQLAFSIF
ncbi:hypothetical protein J6590_065529 [Homalodisca vitripennis]|nr:hypothetical protein J6590_065529 [Homalodisca vitripennis]